MASGQEIEKAIVGLLGGIQAPGGQSLVDAGIIVSMRGGGDRLTITCRNPGWPDPIRDRIDRQIAAVVQSAFPQMAQVAVDWRAEPVPTQNAPPGNAGAAATPPSLDVRHVIAVGSGKGGVGKSTMAASLAYALSHLGHRVGIMDADVYGPSIPHMLGIDAPARVADNKYQPPLVDGMPVMSMGFLVPAEQAVIWRGPMLHKAVSDFLFRVDWGPLDFLVVDLPPGTGDIVISLSQQMPVSGGVIVCTPQEVALLDARKALSMLRTVKIPCLGIIENMSYFIDPVTGNRSDIFGHGGAERWAADAGVPFLGGIPLDMSIRQHGDQGNVRDNFRAGASSRDSLLQVAEQLLLQLADREQAAGPTIEIVEG
jgi:ATP-binding protein involved in chromosome partitioning